MVSLKAAFPDRYWRRGHRRAACRYLLPLAWPAEGAQPLVAIYSTFLQRGSDQMIHDGAAEPARGVCVDRAGGGR